MGQCPSSFVPYQGACVRKCPTERQIIFVSENNQPRCEYRGDSAKNVPLNPVPAIFPQQGKPLPTMESLKTEDPGRYAIFNEESQRVDAALNILIASIDKQKLIDDAFKELQKAENIRDQSPEAYETARVAYYTLTKGEGWINEEKERVSKAEVDPEVNKYIQSYDDAEKRKNVQRQTQDIIHSVKTGVLSLKDDFKYTTNIFKTQIDNLKNQINIERRGREKPDGEGFFTWIDTVLNLLIVIALLLAFFMIWRKMTRRPSPTQYGIVIPPPRLPPV